MSSIPDGPTSIEQNFGHLCAGPHGQPRCRWALVQIGMRSTGAHAIMHVHVETAEPFLLPAVGVVRHWVTQSQARLEKRLIERTQICRAAHVHTPFSSSKAVCSRFVSFETFEIGQHLGIRPSRRSLRRPALVVERVAAQEHHCVDRSGTAQALAARLRHTPMIELGLGNAFEMPVVGAIRGEMRLHGARHAHRPMAIVPAGLE